MPPPLARVRLPVWHYGRPITYTDPSPPGGAVAVPRLRVTVALRLGPDPGPRAVDNRMRVTGLLDTGAPYSVIDGGTWEQFVRWKLIDILTPAAPLPGLTIGGAAKLAYQIGRMRVGVAAPLGDAPQGAMRAVPVVFQLLPVNLGLPCAVVLGLAAGVLDGRRLVREPVPPLPTGENSDAGPTFGQDWFLEAPGPPRPAAR